MTYLKNRIRYYLSHYSLYARALAKWLAVSIIVGVLSGLLGSAFHIGVERATEFRMEHPWILYTLPVIGLVIVAIYKLFRTEGQNTNDIINEVQSGKGIPLRLLP